jgi:AmmeMemoRadiSam system protein A
MDSATIEATKKLDINELVEGLEEGTMELCGYLPVLTLMRTASVAGVSEGTLLKYANSGDVPHGDKSRVVGYFAVLFLSERVGEKEKGVEVEFNLTLEQKKYLLRLARQTIEEYVRNGRRPEIKAPDDPVLVRDGAVFVTIHHKGQLRGCIGQMVAQEPLYKAVMDMAISAATRDYRFPPVKAQELGDIDIEISVLSPLKRIDDWRKIKLGEHGVYIRKGYNSGVFLPQVGRMPGFTLESFLGELCEQKAGLARDCYKDPDAEIYIFTVVEFDESIMKEGK